MSKAKNKNFPKAIKLHLIRDGFNVNYGAVCDAVEQHRLNGLESGYGGIFARGFVPVMGRRGAPLVYSIGGYATNPEKGGFCLKIGMEQKVIPVDCVRRKLEQEITEIHRREWRFVRGKEKKEMECNIVAAMAENAPIRYREVSMMVLPSKQILAVFSVSGSDVECSTALLRTALGSLPIMPFEVLDFAGFNGMVTGYTQAVCDRIESANEAMKKDGRTAPVFSVGNSVTTSNEGEKVRFAGFSAAHASVANSVENDHLNVENIELTFSDAFTAKFHGFEKITGAKWHLSSEYANDYEDLQGDDQENVADLILAADLEIVSGVVTDLHTYFYPIFGGYPEYKEQVAQDS
ncbi:MAG: recombination-associated protein RdgC [Shewanella sp.]